MLSRNYSCRVLGDLIPQTLGLVVHREVTGQASGWPHIPEDAQPLFVQEVYRHRVTGAVLSAATDIGLTPQTVAALTHLHSQEVLHSLPRQVAAARITRGLRDAGIRSLVYKGVALAQQTTGDAAARGAGDVDILVAPQDLTATHYALLALGATFVPGYFPHPDSSLSPLAQTLGCEAPYSWQGISLDVHWRIDPLPQIARMSFNDLWKRAESLTIAGETIHTPGRIDALLITCVHGTKEQWRNLRWMLDVTRQVRAIPEEDWPLVHQRALQTGCAPGLFIGIALANALTPTLAPLPTDHRALHQAHTALSQALEDNAPFEGVVFRDQLARLRWKFRTLPTASAGASILLRNLWATLDMAEVPLPLALAWAYPAVRPFLWLRRLITGKYGNARAASE